MTVLAVVPREASAGPLSNDPSPLAVCQETIRTAALRLDSEARRAVTGCLTRGIECLVGPAATRDSCCGKAERRCHEELSDLDDAKQRFATRILKRRCAVVPFTDVVSPDGLGYGSIEGACGALTPPGSVDDLAALMNCLARLVVRGGTCVIGTDELPRGPEAVACAGLETEFKAATDADLLTCRAADAVPTPSAVPSSGATATTTLAPTPAVTATPTPALTPTGTGTTTPVATATPTSTATTTPVQSATPTVTGTATATPTATATASVTPTPTATSTSTATATVTATSTASASATPTLTPTGTEAPTPALTATPTDTPTATSTRTSTPTLTQSPTPTPTATPVCGNGVLEPSEECDDHNLVSGDGCDANCTTTRCGNGVQTTGEDCDDGNTFNCDSCPRDCRTSTAPIACSSTTVRHAQKVQLQAPAGAVLSGAIFCLDYPSGVVALPGTGNVSGRVSGLSGLVTLNDFNNAAQVTFVTSPGLAEVNPIISFDLCTGQSPPLPTAFLCAVKSASNSGNPLDPATVACSPQ